MHILVVNDDGIESEGLWTLAGELRQAGEVTVAAPDRERSAIGTAVTLFVPLHADPYQSPVDGVNAWAVDGTPSDCTILGLGALAGSEVEMVVSGINPGLNVGEDVHISGTVGGALQGYFRGLPALAVSAAPGSGEGARSAARVAAFIVKLLAGHTARIFINLNVPDLPLEEITGVSITRLARSSHINTVAEDTSGERRRYHMTRTRLPDIREEGTDIQAVNRGEISLTPLYTSLLDKPPHRLLKMIREKLATELIGGK